MTNDELKQALLKKEKVIYTMPDGFSAEYIVHGICYRLDRNDRISISVELIPTKGRECIIYGDPKKVERIDCNEKRILPANETE